MKAVTRRPANRAAALRVLVVDDSDANRDVIVRMLESDPAVQVIGTAADGEDALRESMKLRPDAICLDLEMPRMDGFTLLRLLMARQPTPVIVVSSNARKQDVFKALELGALDFVAKPDRGAPLALMEGELLAKLRTLRSLRIDDRRPQETAGPPTVAPGDASDGLRLVVMGASTGGPAALTRLFGMLPADLPAGLLVAQHMPERFTRAFADRLARTSPFAVSEAADGDLVTVGRALVAPGGRNLRVAWESGPGSALRARLSAPAPDDARYCPSVDALFESAAATLGPRVCAAVLTGMGNDGMRGVEAVKTAGGLTLAEAESSAVVFGMPNEALKTGRVDEVLRLEEIVQRIVNFARSGPVT